MTDVDQSQANLFSTLFGYHLRDSLICVYIDQPGTLVEDKLPNGLVVKHSYSITAIRQLSLHGRLVILVRLRNPWGKVEWNGSWSDHSSEWNTISDKVKRRIGLKMDHDGEFWMSFEDFSKNFNVFECCHLMSHHANYWWNSFEFFGEWNSYNGGGCVNNRQTFPSNPQYLFKLAEQDIDEDDRLCTVIISLTQKHYRYRKSIEGQHILIG